MDILPLLIPILQLFIIFTVIVLLLDNRGPSETFAWIFIFILLPGIGFGIYLLTGRNWKKSFNKKRRLPQYISKNMIALFKPLDDRQAAYIDGVKNPDASYEDDLMKLLYRNSHAVITSSNRVRVLHNGKDKFEALIKDLESAKEFIHLEYFIWISDDVLGRRLKDILIRKAKEGVEIRILYDYSGCFFTLSRFYIRELRKAGIKIFPFFNYLSSFKIHTLNYRNHRKIVVIDGKIGYTGGMNVGQEYIDGGKKYDSWRDTHLRIEGEGVSVLEAVFAIDWFNTTADEKLFDPKFYPLINEASEDKDQILMQFPTSGFDSEWPSILHLYFSMITSAQKNIHLVSPYFIPEESLLMALKTAAMRGVKVSILMTGVPDNPIPYWAAFSYFEELLKSGVKIFQYQKGFMHAKIFTIDGEVGSVGTANFDIRSLKLNYEINTVMYHKGITADLDRQFAQDLKHSQEITMKDLNQTALHIRLRNSIVRLVSPLL